MNLRQTAEVAALASRMAEAVIHSPQPVSTEALHAYWKSSRLRLKYWFAGMRSVPRRPVKNPTSSDVHVQRRVNLAREILVSEILTRVWSSVLVARDVARTESLTSALVRQVFLGQLESRQEVLMMLADEQLLPVAQATSVCRLRRRVERWTDVLVGPLVSRYAVTEFAFDVERAQDGARTSAPFPHAGRNRPIDQLTLVGLSQAIPPGHNDNQLGAALNLAVARSVLSARPLTTISRPTAS